MNEITITLEGKEYQIDIEKAKELGVLNEKDTRCKSWEEFKSKYFNKDGYFVNPTNNISTNSFPIHTWNQLTPEEAIAISAFSKLLKLRRDWIGDWNPDWCNCSEEKFCIEVYKKDFYVNSSNNYSKTFSFPTKEMAKEFLECFKHLFEQCKYLI